jgi:hypothetical protein
MQMTDRLTSWHSDTPTDSGLVHFSHAARHSAVAVMSGNDDVIKERTPPLRARPVAPKSSTGLGNLSDG